MRKIKQKKSSLNLVLNSLKPHESDPTLLQGKFIILDFELSRNNVIVTKEVALETLAKSIINKPIRGHYIEDEEDFGGHEGYVKESKNGEQIFERNTVPMGVFVSEGYVEIIEENGIEKEVLVADAVLWHSQFKEPIDLLVEWFNDGLTISMSCEYVYKNYEIVDDVEYHKSPIYLEAHCILGKEIEPAYESAKLINYSQLNQFKQLVAQSLNQEKEKEDNILENVKNEELEVNEMKTQTNEEDFKNQVNELSHDDIRGLIRDQAKLSFSEESYVWVADVFETYAVVEVEEELEEVYKWTFYKFNYSLVEDKLNLDLNSKEEVKIKREWVAVVEELQAQLNDIKLENEEILKSKEVLAEQLNQATETIVSLNSTITELKPYQELALNAQREEKLVQLNEKFSKAFNNAGAKNKFDSEEVQNLLKEAVDSTDALLSLNTMVVDLITEMQVNRKPNDILLGLNSTRQSLLPDTEDEFEKVYKI